jgi:hypothetical protein
MMAPLPYCLSIWETANPTALSLLESGFAITYSQPLSGLNPKQLNLDPQNTERSELGFRALNPASQPSP